MKLPIAHSIGCRQASLGKDALMRNAVAEIDAEAGIVRARKRPAIDSAFTAASGKGQGLFSWNIPSNADGGTTILVSITGDVLNTAPAPINKALAFTVDPT